MEEQGSSSEKSGGRFGSPRHCRFCWISTIRRNYFPTTTPDGAGAAALCHNSPGSFTHYGPCQAQGTMGLAASRAESFTRVRDVPLSQNEGMLISTELISMIMGE